MPSDKCNSIKSKAIVLLDFLNTKKDSGKSMKNALYVLQYAKRHLLG